MFSKDIAFGQNEGGGNWAFQRAAPSAGQVQGVAAIVSAAAQQYFTAPGMFAFHRALPFVGSPNLSLTYPEYDKGQVFKARLKPRAPGQPFEDLGFDLTWPTVSIQPNGGQFPIPDETSANDRGTVSPERGGVRLLLRAAFAGYEELFESLVDVAAAATTNTDLSAKKWDSGNGVPINDSLNAIKQIASRGGNAMECIGVCNLDVATAMRSNAQLREAVQFGESGGPLMPGMDQIATAMGLREIVVSSAAKSNGEFFLGNNFIVMDAPRTKTAEEPAGAMLVGWTGVQGGAPEGIATRLKRDEINDRDLVQLKTAYNIVVQAKDLIVRLVDVI